MQSVKTCRFYCQKFYVLGTQPELVKEKLKVVAWPKTKKLLHS